jgi:hypothetical protein
LAKAHRVATKPQNAAPRAPLGLQTQILLKRSSRRPYLLLIDQVTAEWGDGSLFGDIYGGGEFVASKLQPACSPEAIDPSQDVATFDETPSGQVCDDFMQTVLGRSYPPLAVEMVRFAAHRAAGAAVSVPELWIAIQGTDLPRVYR